MPTTTGPTKPNLFTPEIIAALGETSKDLDEKYGGWGHVILEMRNHVFTRVDFDATTYKLLRGSQPKEDE